MDRLLGEEMSVSPCMKIAWASARSEERRSSANCLRALWLFVACRLKLALHYWVKWNLLADRWAAHTFAIENVTITDLASHWCNYCRQANPARVVSLIDPTTHVWPTCSLFAPLPL